MLAEEALELVDVEDRLRDRVLGAGLDLPVEAPELVRRDRSRPGSRRRRSTKRVGSPIGLPPRSRPWFRLLTRFVRPIESMSKTAVASG